jgi:hypothetical protein
MIWGSCFIVEALLVMMGGLFLFKASSEEDQSGSDALSDDQVSLFFPL